VTVKERSVVVEEKIVVRENWRRKEAERETMFGSQAVTRPPRLPSAFFSATSESDGGRKDFCLKTSREASLDSWRQRMVGEATETALRTMAHLSESPRPWTFQDSKHKERTDTLSIEPTGTMEIT
jgi:hypothetical protein